MSHYWKFVEITVKVFLNFNECMSSALIDIKPLYWKLTDNVQLKKNHQISNLIKRFYWNIVKNTRLISSYSISTLKYLRMIHHSSIIRVYSYLIRRFSTYIKNWRPLQYYRAATSNRFENYLWPNFLFLNPHDDSTGI